MELLRHALDFVLHLDAHLADIIRDYGGWTYAILFAIIFAETGLVVTPFLPGDSLLFATGALAATGPLNVWFVIVLLTAAAIIGDSVNYSIGARLGPQVFDGRSRFFKREHLERTNQFYEKYGGKTIIIARFVPIVRTFAPFVAGIGAMNYTKFITYNVVGAVLWVWGITIAGYFFGNIPVVQDNFGLVVIAIIVISVLPGVFELVKSRRLARKLQVQEPT